jgi:hypothetical protein
MEPDDVSANQNTLERIVTSVMLGTLVTPDASHVNVMSTEPKVNSARSEEDSVLANQITMELTAINVHSDITTFQIVVPATAMVLELTADVVTSLQVNASVIQTTVEEVAGSVPLATITIQHVNLVTAILPAVLRMSAIKTMVTAYVRKILGDQDAIVALQGSIGSHTVFLVVVTKLECKRTIVTELASAFASTTSTDEHAIAVRQDTTNIHSVNPATVILTDLTE